MVVRVAPTGTGSLTATGPTGASSNYPLQPSADGSPVTVTAQIAGSTVASLTISGTGLAIESLAVVAPFVPRPLIGDLRLLAARLPQTATDKNHAVDMIAHRTTDLAGWSIRWYDARPRRACRLPAAPLSSA